MTTAREHTVPGLIPLEDFFSPPQRAGATISPDGTRIAFLAPWRNRLNVWVEDLEPASEPRCVTADETRSVRNFRWSDDPRWLVYLQDTGGDENWHLFRVDLDADDADSVDLTPYPGARVVSADTLAGRPGTMSFLMNARDASEFDLHEIDIATGEISMVAQSSGVAESWMRGPGNDLLRFSQTSNGGLDVTRLDSATGEFIPVISFDGDDRPLGVAPLEPTPDRTGLWVGSSEGDDLTGLVRVDVRTGEITEVDAHPTLDIDGARRAAAEMSSALIRDRATGELIGVRYLGERQVIHALTTEFANVLKNLEALSDGDVGELSSDESGQRWIVSFAHDRDPEVTWFYDHSTGESRRLYRPFPHLHPEALAPMTPVTINARDGLELPSYLTLPVGIDPTGLPLVVLVHGGPWYRDSWGYQPTVQLLANRGYAVLQVNFRGSVGYGMAHTRAAIGELAGKMHTDLLDAVDWAVAEGYADRDRVAIMGGSYGGYAALVGAAFTPDVFAAAVDYVGISDLENFLRTQPSFLGKESLANNWHRYLGDPDDPQQAAEIRARSPISRVDDIRRPLLIAQGANDTRVVQAESDTIVEALRQRGVDVEYLVFDDEGHGFVNPENQMAFYRAVERFLARHLGGLEQS
ncbi:alpha/beta fold hydrolase [Gordonia jinghuaiqii]|uniref:S9 family peptidase n=1 Tax=Gordonia jinghuaiqii TaxID=2758710 RepID=A0A7D7RSK7_9ACTN|nr:S9 family peptidase [Gordonia jinghuaiqii]MCR5979910.1 alpha/beta fold hydrolase [Gordonia jinghuaiqii]QMT03113.1 S9 family peptidase [Gordonia jinghuaiqii]